jgi:hypothetical protein
MIKDPQLCSDYSDVNVVIMLASINTLAKTVESEAREHRTLMPVVYHSMHFIN